MAVDDLMDPLLQPEFHAGISSPVDLRKADCNAGKVSVATYIYVYVSGAFVPRASRGCASKTNQAHIGARWQWLGLLEEGQWRNDEKEIERKMRHGSLQ